MKRVSSLFLVEDDIDDQDVFIDVLKNISSSINCATALDGEEALNILKNNLPQVPDCIFLDLNMPRMNGRQFLKALKSTAILKNIPVIVYTTSSSLKNKEEMTNLGAAYFLTKPNSLADLKKELEQVLFNVIV
ncbi:MAG: response regulator [Flavisolibacter sp.]|jgi:CheY-like chemotaxis protein|nr:response regulator [Flavisolibacter sp.]